MDLFNFNFLIIGPSWHLRRVEIIAKTKTDLKVVFNQEKKKEETQKKAITGKFNERKWSFYSLAELSIYLPRKKSVRWEERQEITNCVSETPFISSVWTTDHSSFIFIKQDRLSTVLWKLAVTCRRVSTCQLHTRINIRFQPLAYTVSVFFSPLTPM